MKKILLVVAVLMSACGNIHVAPKVITANGGKQVAIACSGVISVGGNQRDGYEVSFTDEKGQSHDWRGLHDVQIDEESQLTKLCPESTTPVAGRELSSDEVEQLRKRNECESRFTGRGIYLVDGVGVIEACKQNPNLVPK